MSDQKSGSNSHPPHLHSIPPSQDPLSLSLSLTDKLRSAASLNPNHSSSPSSSCPPNQPLWNFSHLDQLSQLLSIPQLHSHLELKLDHSNHVPSPDSLERLMAAPYWPLGPSFLRLLQPTRSSSTSTPKLDEDLFSQADLDGSPITDDSASATTMDDLARAERQALDNTASAVLGQSPFDRRLSAPNLAQSGKPGPTCHWSAQDGRVNEPGSARGVGGRFSLPVTTPRFAILPGQSQRQSWVTRSDDSTHGHAHKRAASVADPNSCKRSRTTQWPTPSEAASYSYSPPPQTSSRFRSDVLEARSTYPEPRAMRAPSPCHSKRWSADRWEIGRSPGLMDEAYGSPVPKGPPKLASKHAAHVHVQRGGWLKPGESSTVPAPWALLPEGPRRMREVDNGWGSRAGYQKRMSAGISAATTERRDTRPVRERGPRGDGLSVHRASASPTVQAHLSEEEDEAYYLLVPLKPMVMEALSYAVHSWVNRPIVEAICLLGQWLETHKVWAPGHWGALRSDHIAAVVDGVGEWSVDHIMMRCKARKFEDLLNVPSETGILKVFGDHNDRFTYVKLNKDFTPTGLVFRPLIKSIRRHTVETQETSIEAGSLMRLYVMKNFSDAELESLFRPDKNPMECLCRAAGAGVVQMSGSRGGSESEVERSMVRLAKEWAFPKDRRGRAPDQDNSNGLERRSGQQLQYSAEREMGISKTADELVEMVVRNLWRRNHARRYNPTEREIKEPRRRFGTEVAGVQRSIAAREDKHHRASGGSENTTTGREQDSGKIEAGALAGADIGAAKVVNEGFKNQDVGGDAGTIGGDGTTGDSAVMSSLLNLIDEVFKKQAPPSNNKVVTTPQV